MVALEEFAWLYSDDADESTRLEVLKFARCSAERAEPIFPGLGSGFSSVSPLVLTFRGRENNLPFFSGFEGFSGTGGGFSGGGGGGGPDWLGCRGEDGPDLEKTTLAAVVAAAE